MKTIIISSSIPVNNGDAALVFSLGDAFTAKGFEVIYSTYYYHDVQKLYPQKKFISEIIDYRFLKKIPWLKPFFIKMRFKQWIKSTGAIAIVSAPGGYINSYYGFKHVTTLMKKAKSTGLLTGIYAQSVGPLNEKDGVLLKRMAKNIDFLLARDSFSVNQLKKIDYPESKYALVEDGAFLIKPDFIKKNKSKTIAISVRRWKHDNRSEHSYRELIINLAMQSVKRGFSVEFISTCQGLPGYVDDAEFAKEIYDELPADIQQNSSVDSNYYDFYQFCEKIKDYRLVIGTRLHMCILSLLKGIPALNISYEIKGKECYTYLGLENYTIDYNETTESGVSTYLAFIDSEEEIKKHLHKVITAQHQTALENFNLFIEKVGLV
jgi:polysaccharide pyruvyl transferase WcaK-like protein